MNIERVTLEVEHNRSLKVAVQGLDFMAHSLYIHIYIHTLEVEMHVSLRVTRPSLLTSNWYWSINLIATILWAGQQKNRDLIFGKSKRILSKMSRHALGPNQLPIQ
jgi:hypothetical protein